MASCRPIVSLNLCSLNTQNVPYTIYFPEAQGLENVWFKALVRDVSVIFYIVEEAVQRL